MRFVEKHYRFRPLIWGYLWNLEWVAAYIEATGFPSPNLGLSLKCKLKGLIEAFLRGFRPLIWGYLWNGAVVWWLPLSGTSFPSPNLGLSLKSVEALQWFFFNSFRPLIWGYLWNKRVVWFRYVDMRFRPLIWGYLWNITNQRIPARVIWFPSPNLGLSLKSKLYRNFLLQKQCVSVP